MGANGLSGENFSFMAALDRSQRPLPNEVACVVVL